MAINMDVTIHYITEHGIQPDVKLAYVEETFENYLPELTADGYSFIGWYTSPTFEEDTKIGKDDIIYYDNETGGAITLYAKWLKNAGSVNSKMTALANEIRELSGTSDKLGLDAMTAQLGEANDEVSSQVELLAQAVAALEGKAGSNGVGANIQWHSLKSLPTSYAIEDDFDMTYYMELPSRYCWILFSDQFQIGCYDVFNDKDSDNLNNIYQGMRPSIIEESGVIYLQLTTAITYDLYYAIVEISPIA